MPKAEARSTVSEELTARTARAASGGWDALGQLRQAVERLAGGDRHSREALLTFLRQATPRQWLALDVSQRSYPPWEMTSARPVQTLPVAGDILSVGLATMADSGHVREAGVRRLAQIRDPLAGAFLAIRTVDWVEQVAFAARQELLDRMRSDTDGAVASAPLLVALLGHSRSSDLVEAVLETGTRDATLRQRLMASPDVPLRRAALEVFVKARAIPTADLADMALADGDIVVAVIAGQAAVAAGQSGELVDMTRLLRGPAKVRAAVLSALPAVEENIETAESHLFDRSSSVRGAAQNLIRRIGRDPKGYYRAAVAGKSRTAVAISELGSLRDPSDHPALVDALSSPEASVRRAGVGAVGRSGLADVPRLLSPLLSDVSSGVARAAERVLRVHVKSLDPTELTRLGESNLVHVRRGSYRLRRRRTTAERLVADFQAVLDIDAGLAWEGQQDLIIWLQRDAARAHRGDPAARNELSRALAEVESKLDRRMVGQIRFHAGLRPQDLVLR